MSLARFSPQLRQAFHIPAQNPAMLARIGALWFGLALAATLLPRLDPNWGSLAQLLLNAVAMGGFGATWQRFVALGEAPSTPVAVAFGLRHLAWAAAFLFLGVFESFPAPFLQAMAGEGPNAQVLVLMGLQLFQVLVGGLFLLLPHLALHNRGDGKPTLQEMVLGGGVSVGLGYAVAGLPFLIAALLLRDGAIALEGLPGADVAVRVVQEALSFLAVGVTSTYFALVWQDLRQTTQLLPPEAPAEDAPKGKKKRK